MDFTLTDGQEMLQKDSGVNSLEKCVGAPGRR